MNRNLRIRLYDRLASMQSAGIPLNNAVGKVRQQMNYPELDAILHALGRGDRAAEAFAAAGFEPFETHLIAAGERGARLDEVFRSLSLYFQRERSVTRSITMALVYPVCLLNAIAFIGPLPDLILECVWTYAYSVIFSLVVIWGLLIGFYLFVRLTWNLEAMRFFWLHVPLVGGFLRTSYQYRWIMVLRMELHAGVGFAQAAADAWAATSYGARADRAQEVERRLYEGERLSSAMLEWPELPADWSEYLATAEESGKIDETLGQVEALALDNWKHAQERLASWMPLLLYAMLIIAAGAFLFSFVAKAFEPLTEALDKL